MNRLFRLPLLGCCRQLREDNELYAIFFNTVAVWRIENTLLPPPPSHPKLPGPVGPSRQRGKETNKHVG